MRTSNRTLIASLTLAFGVASCGPTAPSPARYVLSDGTVVAIDALGAFTLTSATGHSLAATAPGASPTAAAYDQSIGMVQGFYTFRRSEVVETAFRIYEGCRRGRGCMCDRPHGDDRRAVGLTARLLAGSRSP